MAFFIKDKSICWCSYAHDLQFNWSIYRVLPYWLSSKYLIRNIMTHWSIYKITKISFIVVAWNVELLFKCLLIAHGIAWYWSKHMKYLLYMPQRRIHFGYLSRVKRQRNTNLIVCHWLENDIDTFTIWFYTCSHTVQHNVYYHLGQQ